MGGVPVSVALVAGGLAVFNPCAFPLLPAFLSFYVGADEAGLPRTATRVAQGLLIGLLVTAGFLGVFSLLGLPIVLGAGAVADAVPWTGLAAGGYLAYYWGRIRFGNVSTLADDPVVGVVTRYAAEIESGAAGRAWLILAAGAAVLVLAAGFALRCRRRPALAFGLLALCVAALVLALVLPGGSGTSTRVAVVGGPADVESVAHFQVLFNQASDDPQLVLILSPT